MAAIHRSLPQLSFVLIFLTSMLFLPRATIATSTDLATQVCRNTTNYAFCQEVVYSDPRAAGADQYFLSYIVFRQAYSNATETRDFIASKLKSMGGSGGGSDESGQWRKCLGYYDVAIQRLTEIQGNLDSDTYSDLDTLSLEVEDSIRTCKTTVGDRSVLSQRNEDMIKLSNICLVVSKLYVYT